jgi:ABC-type transport system involved in multi-copper enzyme maturation permease subunit
MTAVSSQTAAARRETPGLFGAAARVFDLSVGEMLWSRRTIFMALVVGGPVVIALAVRAITAISGRTAQFEGIAMTGPAMFGMMIWFFYLRFTVPVLGVFYGTALIADEVDDKTITYLFTRPIRRGAVLVGKYLAYLAVTSFVVLPSVMLVYLLVAPINGSLGASFIPLLKDLALLALGLATYGAFFAFVGAKFSRPLLTGLIWVFGWEQAALAFPGYLKRFTIAYYLQALVPHAMPQDSVMSLIQGFFRETPGLGISLFWLVAICVGALWMAMRAVETKEYVLEQ